MDKNKLIDNIKTFLLTFAEDGLYSKEELIEKGIAMSVLYSDVIEFSGSELRAAIGEAVEEILASLNIVGGDTFVFENRIDHEEWLNEESADITWYYWESYKKYLRNSVKLPPDVIRELNHSTDEVLKRLESPRRSGNWERRGMVVGNIQSGKTSNYTGLICKAVDAGYKVIIVLGGSTKDLRAQTQTRIDLGFIGKDTCKNGKYDQTNVEVGAGLYRNRNGSGQKINALTSADINGDYKKNIHSAIMFESGGNPIIAVVKKNVSPLRNLLDAFQRESGNGRTLDAPLLIIDDEADYASVNTKNTKASNGDELDPTRINGLIRKILNQFSKSCYVGYTATPFANIFINPEIVQDSEYGNDLFPRSFIVNLEPPSNYIGPVQLFGLPDDSLAKTEEKPPLPLLRIMSDADASFPVGHKKDLRVEEIPESLIDAIYSFILAASVRYFRKQSKTHNSMLIHLSRFIAVQHQLEEKLKDIVDGIREDLEFKTGPRYEKTIKRFKKLFNTDFLPTTLTVLENGFDPAVKPYVWENIEPLLYKFACKTEVKEINGEAVSSGLNYNDYPNGAMFIAVGGDKLSRGLTLEGLTVSYYFRQAKTYDTLLQMGRWFGYRNGYVDLCRLYTSKTLSRWYKFVTLATEELRRDLNDMAYLNATPENYGLKVRTHPEGMLVTALNKSKNASKTSVSFAGSFLQTPRYLRKDPKNETNLRLLSKWISELGKPSLEPSVKTRQNYVWENVTPNQIISLISSLYVYPDCPTASSSSIAKYIRSQNQNGELTDWTVALMSSTRSGAKHITVADLDVGLAWRTNDIETAGSKNMVSLLNRNLASLGDQGIGLSSEQLQRAMEKTLAHWEAGNKTKPKPENPRPSAYREVRHKKNGLFLIYTFESGEKLDGELIPYEEVYVGYCISFPSSPTAKPVTYLADEVYKRLNDCWENMDI